jgi:hypothetical protein
LIGPVAGLINTGDSTFVLIDIVEVVNLLWWRARLKIHKNKNISVSFLSMWLMVLFVFLRPSHLQAETLFEGYYKVYSGGTHAGYMIAKYEYDAKKKQFSATTFLKTGELAGSITESLKATATEDLKPISYQYTTLMGTVTKTIDASFPKGKMIATVKDGGKSEKIAIDLPKGTFLSTFLAYLILKSKDGLKAETKYDYQAIAEEDGKITKGFALVKGKEDVGGINAFRIINEFKNSKYVSYVTEKGELLSVKSPAQGISEELVTQPSLATGSFQVPVSLLKILFGDVPTGQLNEVSRSYQAQKAKEIEKNTLPVASPTEKAAGEKAVKEKH